MRYWVGFVAVVVMLGSPLRGRAQNAKTGPAEAALGLTISPVGGGAQETREPGGWPESELEYLKCTTFRRADGMLVATFAELVQGAPEGRLDDFYPGTPPQRTFDEEKLDDFYPERAERELGYINRVGASEASRRTGISKGGKIAIGVVVPLVAVGIAVGATAAVWSRNLLE